MKTSQANPVDSVQQEKEVLSLSKYNWGLPMTLCMKKVNNIGKQGERLQSICKSTAHFK